MAHRREREAQILDQLARKSAGVSDLTARIYHDVPSALQFAARRNVLAHLIDLTEKSLVRAIPDIAVDARFELR